MVMAGPMPGSTPTAVPMNTPNSANSRYMGCSAVGEPVEQRPRVIHQKRAGREFQQRAGRSETPKSLAEDQSDDQPDQPPATAAGRRARAQRQAPAANRSAAAMASR